MGRYVHKTIREICRQAWEKVENRIGIWYNNTIKTMVVQTKKQGYIMIEKNIAFYGVDLRQTLPLKQKGVRA